MIDAPARLSGGVNNLHIVSRVHINLRYDRCNVHSITISLLVSERERERERERKGMEVEKKSKATELRNFAELLRSDTCNNHIFSTRYERMCRYLYVGRADITQAEHIQKRFTIVRYERERNARGVLFSNAGTQKVSSPSIIIRTIRERVGGRDYG